MDLSICATFLSRSTLIALDGQTDSHFLQPIHSDVSTFVENLDHFPVRFNNAPQDNLVLIIYVFTYYNVITLSAHSTISIQSFIVDNGHTAVPFRFLDCKHVPHASISPPNS